MMTFGEKLKKARQKANLSQKEMAEKLEINIRTYGSYERDERDVSTSLLLKICNTLHISSDELLHTDAQNNPAEENQQEHRPEISDDDIKFALWGGAEGITDEMYEEVRQYAEMVKMREEKKKE